MRTPHRRKQGGSTDHIPSRQSNFSLCHADFFNTGTFEDMITMPLLVETGSNDSFLGDAGEVVSTSSAKGLSMLCPSARSATARAGKTDNAISSKRAGVTGTMAAKQRYSASAFIRRSTAKTDR